MIAIDTNIVLRLVLNDDAAQVAAARDLLERETLYVTLTVLLETGWVLESRYRMPRTDVADALIALISLTGVEVARRSHVIWAIARYRQGADLADVIHVVSASKLKRFATFERKLSRRAGDGSPAEIETLA